jgi:hypothetical protein
LPLNKVLSHDLSREIFEIDLKGDTDLSYNYMQVFILPLVNNLLSG